MAQAAPIIIQSKGPGLLIRVIYFVFVGWWLGAICSGLAWILNVTVIGLPAGLWIINRLPTVITLRPQNQQWSMVGGQLVQGRKQRSFIGRAIYFILVGWWFSGLWLGLAYAALVTILLIPLAFWMYGRVGAITTLFRS